MATGDNTASVPFPRLSQTRREGIPHVPGTTKSWPRRGAGARIIAKEHGLTPAGDAQEIRPSTPETGIITDEKLTKAAGQENSDPAVAGEFLAAETTGEDSQRAGAAPEATAA